MSLVVAIKDKSRIVIGADKQTSIGDTKDHTCTKIWPVDKLPGAIMGGVGLARASQIIQYSDIIDKNYLEEDVTTEFIIKNLVPTICATLEHNGIACGKEDESDIMPNAFIFAYKDKAWMIWNDLSVSEIQDTFVIGSGSDVARGVLFATKDKNPFDRIVTCIDAAAESTLFVDNGVDLLVTDQLPQDEKQMIKALGLEEEYALFKEELLKKAEEEKMKDEKKPKKKAKKPAKSKEKETKAEAQN